jgi:hypothetical protein
MKAKLLIGLAALVLLAVPAVAQKDLAKTIDPIELTQQAKRPQLKVSDEQKNAIQNALVAEHTQQKTPKDFQPQLGMTLPTTMKVDAPPETLVREQPSLKQYGYAKTPKDILVLDPMNKKIIAVLPRKFPSDANANAKTPADWADTKGRELTGQAPKGANPDQFSESAGDAVGMSNSNKKNAHQDMGVKK